MELYGHGPSLHEPCSPTALTATERNGETLLPQEHSEYDKYALAVQRETQQLKFILDGVQAKQQERQWRRNQPFGDLDDARLVDGLAGETSIYKRRAEQPPEPFSFQVGRW
jgi:hypothetical protein